MNLLQMSFTGAVMILAVTVIRALAINKVPKKTFLVLWGIALVRLMIPFSLPSWFSIYSLWNREMPTEGRNYDGGYADTCDTSGRSGHHTAQYCRPCGECLSAGNHLDSWMCSLCVLLCGSLLEIL